VAASFERELLLQLKEQEPLDDFNESIYRVFLN